MVLFAITILASLVAAAITWHLTSQWGWWGLFKFIFAVGAFIGTPYLLAALHLGIDKNQIQNFVTFVS